MGACGWSSLVGGLNCFSKLLKHLINSNFHMHISPSPFSQFFTILHNFPQFFTVLLVEFLTECSILLPNTQFRLLLWQDSSPFLVNLWSNLVTLCFIYHFYYMNMIFPPFFHPCQSLILYDFETPNQRQYRLSFETSTSECPLNNAMKFVHKLYFKKEKALVIMFYTPFSILSLGFFEQHFIMFFDLNFSLFYLVWFLEICFCINLVQHYYFISKLLCILIRIFRIITRTNCLLEINCGWTIFHPQNHIFHLTGNHFGKCF